MANDGITVNMVNKLFAKISRDQDHSCKVRCKQYCIVLFYIAKYIVLLHLPQGMPHPDGSLHKILLFATFYSVWLKKMIASYCKNAFICHLSPLK